MGYGVLGRLFRGGLLCVAFTHTIGIKKKADDRFNDVGLWYEIMATG